MAPPSEVKRKPVLVASLSSISLRMSAGMPSALLLICSQMNVLPVELSLFLFTCNV